MGEWEKRLYARFPAALVLVVLWGGAAAAVFGCNFVARNAALFTWMNFIMALFTLLLFITIFFARQNRLGPLSWLGKISYSVYLWHFPLLFIAKKTAILQHVSNSTFYLAYGMLLLIISAFSYYFIEEMGFVLRDRYFARRAEAKKNGSYWLLRRYQNSKK
ncbi:MAG: acyltransferase family protein [Gammaproteobacteria bacterium]|nr:acyltransferase family protein [Gammaproteobacteria bacterium]